MSPVHSMGAMAYRAAVQLYPPTFRREFADEMTRDFVQATREASRTGMRGSVARLWAHIGADLVCSLVLQWIRTGMPAVVLIACVFSFAGIGLGTSLVYGKSWATPPASEMDADLVAFFLMTIVVLLIIVSTICVTLWITRSIVYRRRE